MRRFGSSLCRKAAICALSLLVGSLTAQPRPLPAADPPPPKLQADTLAAIDRYVRLTDERNRSELERGGGLLWIDSLSEAQRKDAYDALARVEVQVQQLTTLDNGKPISCPGGTIHHWVGVVFLPNAKIDNVLAVLQDYDHQSTYYAPDVERSKTESRDGDHFRVFLRFRRHKVITVVLNSEH